MRKDNRFHFYHIAVVFILFAIAAGCGSKYKTLRRTMPAARTQMTSDNEYLRRIDASDTVIHTEQASQQTQITFKSLYGDAIAMSAERDSLTGESILTDKLNAIVVEAKFRNVAERNGKVDIAFDIIVPAGMLDSDWQTRFSPRLYIMEDTMRCSPIYITGDRYRERQLRGYELYERYLKRIIGDDADYINTFTYKHLLNIYIERNFEGLALLRNDTTYYDPTVLNAFGRNVEDAIEYYTRQLKYRNNERLKSNRGRMFQKYVPAPIMDDMRLDSVITNADSSIRYCYVQPIQTRKGLRRVDMVLTGDIWQQADKIYEMQETEPLTYYISSISTLKHNTVRYIQKTIYRNAEANTTSYIAFKVNSSVIDDTLFNNGRELAQMKYNIASIMDMDDYVVDSLRITALSSPEGGYDRNMRLSRDRAESLKKYVSNYFKFRKDSLAKDLYFINLDDSYTESRGYELKDFTGSIKADAVAENWDRLYELLECDTLVNRMVIDELKQIDNPDSREARLRMEKSYARIKAEVYPLLRYSSFNFYLHRKGMIAESMVTDEVDTVYANGLAALDEHDYARAVELLRPYQDYNSAVAFLCNDMNLSAKQILEPMEQSSQRDYLLAIVYSRLGDDQKACEFFVHSVEQEGGMRHRGNLDPEISMLIRKYRIDQVLDELEDKMLVNL